MIVTGKYQGYHTGRVAVRTTGMFNVNKMAANYRHFCPLQQNDGYCYNPILRTKVIVTEEKFVKPAFPYKVISKKREHFGNTYEVCY